MTSNIRKQFTFAGNVDLEPFCEDEDILEAQPGLITSFAEIVKPNNLKQPASPKFGSKPIIPALRLSGPQTSRDLRIGSSENSPRPSARRLINPFYASYSSSHNE